ncbi:ribonuclease H-like domain-containing protein [Tanacetum coccineum]
MDTDFVNKTLYDYYESVGIFHQKTVPRTPQQNGVVERQNRTLVEAARTMLIFSKAPMFLWAEALATVFGALCYPINDSKNLGKLQPRADIGIFIGYAPSRKGYRIYNNENPTNLGNYSSSIDEMSEANGSLSLIIWEIHDAEPKQSTQPVKLSGNDRLSSLVNIIGDSPSIVIHSENSLLRIFVPMQEEIHDVDRLDVWELVPPPDCAMIIALKWIYKVKLDEYGEENNEKALNILLSAIPDRHLLSFHDATNAKTLWTAIKARFGGNEASKKMQKNLLKQQFETLTIGSREELDLAYERFQTSLVCLELYDATVYEHELKGVSNSSSPNIAFLSTEVKGSTLKQSTADSANIPKGYTQAASSKVHTAPNYASHSDEIICSFFSQQASMPTTHDDEDLLQIDEDAMEEIDIRWQVAMITARIRKFMRKTGRPIDLKPKNGITFDKSKIECFNCQKLGHFARECRFAKYQENRANGRQEKKIVAIEDSNSKALVATDNNEDIDWTKEFDAEPVTFAMMALTGVDEDDWSMEIDSEPMHFGQDGLGDFDWSNTADDAPVSLALMATNSEVPYCSKCSKSYKLLLENYQKERDNFQKARSEILGYQMSLESLEVMLKTHEKNEYAWGDKYEQMEYDLKIRDLKLEEKQKELDQALKERDDFKVKLEKWTNASVLQNEVLNKQRYLSDKSCIGFGIESSSSMESDISSGDETLTDTLYENFKREKAYKAVPPPTGTIIPPRANVSFTGIDELAIRNKVVNQEKTKSNQPEIDRNKVIIEDWVDSDDEETDVSEIQKETVFNSENSEKSFENRSPNSQNSVGNESRTKGLGNKGGKLCFVFYRTRTPYRTTIRLKNNCENLSGLRKDSMLDPQASLSQHESVKKSAMITSEQTWRQKGNYLDSVNTYNGSYTLKQFEEDPQGFIAILTVVDLGCRTGDKDQLLRHKVNDHKVVTQETEFKNQINEWSLCKKDIKREWREILAIAKNSSEKGVAERKNRTLIEAARTMLADSLLPIQFWAEAVNTACYVLNRVLVTKPQMKTPI